MADKNGDILVAVTSERYKADVVDSTPALLKGPNKPKNLLRRVVEEFPSQTAQLASLPVLVACLTASSGLSSFRQLAAAVVSGEPIGAVAVASATILAILTVGSIAQMKEGLRATDHDRDQASKADELAKKFERLERRGEKERAKDLRELMRVLDELTDRLDRLTHEQIARKETESHIRKNVAEVWSNYAPRSVAHSVNGQLRLDVYSEMQADGSIRLVPDYNRLLNWLKRYGLDGISRANLILFTDDPFEGAVPNSVTRQIAMHLTAFRALKALGKAYEVPLRLDGIRFFLQKNSNSRQSFFIGTYGFGEKNVDFVLRYCDFAAMFNVPRTMLDDEVEVLYSADAVAKYRHLAEALMVGVPCLTLDEMETRYGHLVPQLPPLDPSFAKGYPMDLKNVNWADDGFVVNGDHFVIR